MIINKEKGKWCEEGETDYIDDIAFQLYLNFYIKEYNSFNEISPQSLFKHVRDYPGSYYYSYYKNAFNVLRKEKLETIENVNR